MPGGRRKSRNPQKWEEQDFEVLENENQNVNSSETQEFISGGENSYSHEKERSYSMNCNNRLLPSGYNKSSSQFSTNSSALKDDTVTLNKQHGSNTNSNNLAVIHKENEASNKGPSTSSTEMTVQEVLRSARPGTFAECNICNIRLKDWENTVSHIQAHRSTFLPSCVAQDRAILMKQNVTCFICQKQLNNITFLISHIRTSHNLTISPFICPLCGKVFDSSSNLLKHIDFKDVCMKCPVCSATCNQEYQLYAHLSDCLSTFHPHLSHLICHICNQKIEMNNLAEHMIQHSFHGTDQKTSTSRKSTANNLDSVVSDVSKDKEVKNEPSMFLCEVCDERYSTFHQFKSHLNKHSESKKFCPLCYLKGFSRADFVVRHLMLRCPRRTPDQFAFGSIITSIGKYHNHHFLEVLKDIQSAYPFHEGFEAWASVTAVLDFLNSFKTFSKEELRQLPELSSAFPTGETAKNPTDIELLVWLTEFEREMHAALQSSTNGSDKKVCSSYSSISLPPKDLSDFERTILNENLNYVLKKDESGKPIEYNFESVDGQVTITPHTQVDDPIGLSQKIMEQRPSVGSLKKSFPGLCFLPDVDISTLKRLNEEAMKLVKVKPVEDHIKNGGAVSAEDFDRLDWEAQYLRSKEQFYVKTDDKVQHFSPLRKPKKTNLTVVDEKILQKLREEAKELAEETSKSKKMKLVSLNDKDIERLTDESKQV